MTIFEALRADHDKQRELLQILVETSGDTEDRREHFDELKVQLQEHAIAEERCFYKTLIDSDTTVELSRHGIAEHHEIDELIEVLDETEMSSPAWLQHFKNLKHKVEHHLDEEEKEFFPVAGKVLSQGEKQQLADDYQEEMDVSVLNN